MSHIKNVFNNNDNRYYHTIFSGTVSKDNEGIRRTPERTITRNLLSDRL